MKVRKSHIIIALERKEKKGRRKTFIVGLFSHSS